MSSKDIEHKKQERVFKSDERTVLQAPITDLGSERTAIMYWGASPDLSLRIRSEAVDATSTG